LFEARARLGGRILTVTDPRSDLAMDLGPTWFWPDRQPRIVQLVAELGLKDFAQHDEGQVLHLRDPDKSAEVVGTDGVHSGARRLEGGMGSLIDALAKDLPKSQVHLEHMLTSVRESGDHVTLTFRAGDRTVEIEARHVVLALPPRLIDEHVTFEPALDEPTRNAMRDAGTWMAAQAKVAMTYDRPVWREAGQAGNAFVTHEQAVVGEIYDACDRTGSKAALAGFLKLDADLRQQFAVGLPILMESQMVMVFGTALGNGEQYFQDWATELYTCSTADLNAAPTEHTGFANPMLRRALWDGRLHLGGSETGAAGAGYLEGAVEAARRIERALLRASAGTEPSRPSDSVVPIHQRRSAREPRQHSDWVATQSDKTLTAASTAVWPHCSASGAQQALLGSVEDVTRMRWACWTA
jgi:monoamine oxidase